MGIFDCFRSRCKLCGRFSSDRVISVPSHGIYGTSYREVKYHEKCLEQVLGNPEEYGHRTVDMAIEIAERFIEKQKERAKRQAELETVHSYRIRKAGELMLKLLGTPKN